VTYIWFGKSSSVFQIKIKNGIAISHCQTAFLRFFETHSFYHALLSLSAF